MSKLLKFNLFLVLALVLVFAFTATADAALRLGDKGADVMTLQQTLNMKGYTVATSGAGSMGMETTYFGPMTDAAVRAMQTAKGLVVDGIYGPLSMAALSGSTTTGGGTTVDLCPNGMTVASNCAEAPGGEVTEDLCPNGKTVASNCADAPGEGTSTGPLEGTFGEISQIDQLSQYNNEEVGSGSEDIKVMGFEVTAANDGDIALTALKLTFDSEGNNSADSDRITDYLDMVHVYMGDDEVASADLGDFTKDSTGIYSKTLQLNGVVVKADTSEKFYVSVDAVSNLDSGDIDSDSWTVAINNMRYEDGAGVITTVSSSDSLLTGSLDYDAAGDGVGISFVTFSAASDTELKLKKATSSPDAGIVEVSTTATTDDVVLLKGTMEVEGTSDVWLDVLPVLFTATGATNTDDIAATVYLSIDGTTYSESMTADAGTTDTVDFDNLDLWLTAGETYDVEVLADVAERSGAFDEGDTLKADLGETQTDDSDFSGENAEGDALTDAEKTGTIAGNAQAFYTEGIGVELVSVSSTKTSDADPATSGSADQAQYIIKYDITAFGGDMYVDNSCVEDNDGSEVSTATSYSVTNDGDNTTACVMQASGTDSDATDSANTFLVDEGDTREFTLTVNVTATASDFAAVSLEAIGWDNAAGGDDNVFDFDLPGEFETDPIYLNVTA